MSLIIGPIQGSSTPSECRGCGRCCYFKYTFSDLDIYWPCPELDQETNKCTEYENRPAMCKGFWCKPEGRKFRQNMSC